LVAVLEGIFITRELDNYSNNDEITVELTGKKCGGSGHGIL
jgi:hypothetical protein